MKTSLLNNIVLTVEYERKEMATERLKTRPLRGFRVLAVEETMMMAEYAAVMVILQLRSSVLLKDRRTVKKDCEICSE